MLTPSLLPSERWVPQRLLFQKKNKQTETDSKMNERVPQWDSCQREVNMSFHETAACTRKQERLQCPAGFAMTLSTGTLESPEAGRKQLMCLLHSDSSLLCCVCVCVQYTLITHLQLILDVIFSLWRPQSYPNSVLLGCWAQSCSQEFILSRYMTTNYM